MGAFFVGEERKKVKLHHRTAGSLIAASAAAQWQRRD